jgi:hypothetical protein
MDDAAGGSGESVTGETADVVAQSAVASRVSLLPFFPTFVLADCALVYKPPLLEVVLKLIYGRGRHQIVRKGG